MKRMHNEQAGALNSTLTAGTAATETGTGMALGFAGVSKRFGRRKIIDRASLELTPGRCHLLLGDNGAGKSTLMRIMAGLLKPDQGTVDWGGGPRHWRAGCRCLRESVVYLHQRPYLFDASMRDNIAYAILNTASSAEREERVRQALAWAGLEGLGDAHANHLSGGERQRLALARAWARGAPVLLLDEPASAMDADARRRFYQLLETLVEQGRTLLLATHDPGHFLGLSPSVLKLDAGHVHSPDGITDRNPVVVPLSRRSIN